MDRGLVSAADSREAAAHVALKEVALLFTSGGDVDLAIDVLQDAGFVFLQVGRRAVRIAGVDA